MAGPCGLAGSHAAWASRLPSHPAADTRVKGERRGGRPQTHTGEGDSEGGGDYMARSQPIVYSLSLACSLARSLIQSITQSLLCAPFPPPSSLVRLSLALQLAGPDLHTSFHPSLCCATSPTLFSATSPMVNKLSFRTRRCLTADWPIGFRFKVIRSVQLPAPGQGVPPQGAKSCRPRHQASC